MSEQTSSEQSDSAGREAALDRINDDPAWAQRAYGAGQIRVPQRTLDDLDAAIEAISVARRELDNAMQLVKPLSPNMAVLLDDDMLRLAQRRTKIADLRAGCSS